MMLRNSLGTALAVALVVLCMPAARADISQTIFAIEMCNDSGVCIGYLPIDRSLGTTLPNGNFFWQLTQDVDILDVFDNPLATLSTEGGGTSITIVPPGAGRANPQVNVNFSVIGGTTPGNFTITSALVSFPTMASATGQVNVGINLTDRTPYNGAALTNAAGYGGKSYSWVNGLPGDPGATQFRQLFSNDLSITGGSVSGTDQTAGFEPIGTSVSSISGQIKFTLSARDLASGSSTFIVTPEPASLLMLLGLAALLRRR